MTIIRSTILAAALLHSGYAMAQEFVFRMTLPAPILFSQEGDTGQEESSPIETPATITASQYEWIEWHPAVSYEGTYSTEPILPTGLFIDSGTGVVFGQSEVADDFGPYEILLTTDEGTIRSDAFHIEIETTPHEKAGISSTRTTLLNGQPYTDARDLQQGDVIEIVYPLPVWSRSFLISSYSSQTTLSGKVYAMIDGDWTLVMDENSTNSWSAPIMGYFNRHGGLVLEGVRNFVVSDRFRIEIELGIMHGARNPYVN